jgi:hypothetical protein
MLVNLKSLFTYIIVLSIYISSIMFNLSLSSFDIYWYYPIYIFILFYFTLIGLSNKIDTKIFIILISILLISLFNNLFLYDIIFKQWFNLTFFILFSFLFLKYINFDFNFLFDKYFFIGKLFIIFGFFQVIMFLLNLGDNYLKIFSFLTIPGTITYRFQSIDREPSFIAYTLMPAIYISFFNLIYKKNYFISKNWSILFIISYLLTFSLIAYLGIIFIIISFIFKNISLFNATKHIFYAFLAILFFYYTSKRSDISLRVNDSIKIIKDNDFNANKINSSTYALYSNFLVTKSTLSNNFLFGSGIGTHEYNYKKYLPNSLVKITAINNKEAASLFLRILSEGGFISLILFFYFIHKYRIPYNAEIPDNYFKLFLFNNGIYFMILLRLIRQGHYTVSGFTLFLLIFYYTYNQFSNKFIFDK